MITITLHGAYGRQYPNHLQAKADWVAGKDFKIENGPYCSIRDMPALTRRHDRVIIATGAGPLVLKDYTVKDNPLDKLI